MLESNQEFIVVWNYNFLDLSQYRHFSLRKKTGVRQQIVKTLHVNEEKRKEVHQQSEQTGSTLSIRREVRLVQMLILSVFIEAPFRNRCTQSWTHSFVLCLCPLFFLMERQLGNNFINFLALLFFKALLSI